MARTINPIPPANTITRPIKNSAIPPGVPPAPRVVGSSSFVMFMGLLQWAGMLSSNGPLLQRFWLSNPEFRVLGDKANVIDCQVALKFSSRARVVISKLIDSRINLA